MIKFLLDKSVPGVNFALQDAYMKNNDIAFAKGQDGSYIFPEKYTAAKEFNTHMFKLHPYITGGIAGANLHMLTEAVTTKWRR